MFQCCDYIAWTPTEYLSQASDYRNRVMHKNMKLQIPISCEHCYFRFYLGLALSLRPSGPGTRASEAFSYIQEAMELLLTKQTNIALGTEKR